MQLGLTGLILPLIKLSQGQVSVQVSELVNQTTTMLNGQPAEPMVFPQTIAFNAIPHIDTFQDNGYTREEMKMVWETQKILNDQTIKVNPTAVRVPVLYGHSEAVHIETNSKISIADVRQLLVAAPGVTVIDDPKTEQYPTALSDASWTRSSICWTDP